MTHPKFHSHDHTTSAAGTLKDPVCGMAVTESSKHREVFLGRHYYFCSGNCQSKFHANPEQFIETTERPRSGLQ